MSKRKAAAVISDPRFARLHTDARFQVYQKKRHKVEIDDRFAGVFNDKRFQDSRAGVDKRGRKVKPAKAAEDLARYYRLQEPPAVPAQADLEAAEQEHKEKQEQNEQEGEGEGQAPLREPSPAADSGDFSSDSDSSGGGDEADGGDGGAAGPGAGAGPRAGPATEAQRRWARMRGLSLPGEEEGSDSEASEETGSSGEEAEEDGAEEEALDLEEWGAGALAANPDEAIPTGEATSRLALVDLDWGQVSAADILAVLRSFLSQGQAIRRVTVYPSDYGLERMREEAAAGPRALLPRAKQALGPAANGAPANAQSGGASDTDEDSSAGKGVLLAPRRVQAPRGANGAVPGAEGSGGSDDEGVGGDSSGEDSLAGQEADEQEDDGDSTDSEAAQRRLAAYERARLRYFYAVIECGDVAAAEALYAACDGLEFERSATKLDLRFVPEGQSFEGRDVRDTATTVPAGYEPPPCFTTAALQQSKVRLTWDDDSADRQRGLAAARRVRAEELRDDDFKAYLGSDSDDSQKVDGGAAQAQRARALLLGSGPPGGGPAEERRGGKAWGAAGPGEGPEDGPKENPEGDGGDRPGSSSEEEGDAPRERGDVDLEVTFTPGLEKLEERLAAKRAAGGRKGGKGAAAGDTVWQAYLKKQREKREAARRGRRGKGASSGDESSSDPEGGPQGGAADPFFAPEEDPFDDPFFQGDNGAGKSGSAAAVAAGKDRKQKKGAAAANGKQQEQEQRQRQRQEEARRKAELELLLLDEGQLQDGVTLGLADQSQEGQQGVGRAGEAKRAKRGERARARKAARLRERTAGSDEEDMPAAKGGFKADLDDARFAALFSDPRYGVDPTDPRARGASEGLAAEVAKRRGKQPGRDAGRGAAEEGKAALAQAATASKPGGGDGDLKALVASLKGKSRRAKQPAS